MSVSHPTANETSNPTFSIRTATAEDADLVAAFGARTFAAAFGADNEPEDMKLYLAEAFDPARIVAQIRARSATFFLAWDSVPLGGSKGGKDSVLVGYLHLQEGPAHETVTGPKPIELARIYVDTSTIGGGYGSRLLEAGLDQARGDGFETIWLGVWEKNERACRFYERWGFRTVGTKQFSLGNDVQDDLVMARSLT